MLGSRASHMGSIGSLRPSTSKAKLNTSKASIGTVSRMEKKFEPDYFLYNNISPDDIEQGHCGNCYFLSCLSSIAEFPDRIQKMFLQQEVQESGCYAMRMFLDGVPREVVVDDLFPYDSHKE